MNEATASTTPTTTSPATSGRTAAPPAAGGPGGHGLLRAALLVDAVVTGANGLAYLVGTDRLSLLGYAASLLRGVGVFLLVYAMVIAVVSRTRPIPAAGAWFAIVLNVAWTVVSLACAAGMVTALSGVSALGRVWTALQALVVLAFAVAQWVGWRRAGTHRG